MPALVSIVIPCYKGERFLPEAIESCLQQSYHPLEVIVVDDASPDRCGLLAEEFAARDPRVRVIRLPRNGGVSGAFNAGFDAAKGEFMARLAQDDLFEKHAIEEMVRLLTENPSAGLVYGDEQIIDEEGKVLWQVAKPEPDKVLSRGNKVGLCVMWRRTVWETVGKFDSRFDTAEDYEYWLRVRERFDIVHYGTGPLLSFRRHSEMGSKVFSGKQEVLAAKLCQAYCKEGWVARRKILQAGYFDASYNYREHGKRWEALKWAIAAIYSWPFRLDLFRLLASILFGVTKARKGPPA